MIRPGNTLPKKGNFFPKSGNGSRTFAERSKAAHRTHLTWSGKARDLPSFAAYFADASAAGPKQTPGSVRAETANPSSEPRGGRLPQSRPAADQGGA